MSKTPLEQALLDKLKQIDEERDRKRAVILAALEVERGGTPTEPAIGIGKTVFNTITNAIEATQSGFVIAAIHQMVREGTKEFTKADVLKKLKEGQAAGIPITKYTLDNLSSFLWRLHRNPNDRVIEVKQEGQGQTPSIYVMKSS